MLLQQSISRLLFPLTLACAVTAQTIGVPGVNDLEVSMPPSLPGLAGSGTTSCFVVPGVHSCTSFGVLQYRVNANPTSVGSLLILSVCPPCGGTSNFPFSFAGCSGGAGGNCTASNPSTNRCLALNLMPGCSLNLWMFPGLPGFHHIRILVPPATCFGLTIWAQAVIVDQCAPGGFHFSQALGIN